MFVEPSKDIVTGTMPENDIKGAPKLDSPLCVSVSNVTQTTLMNEKQFL